MTYRGVVVPAVVAIIAVTAVAFGPLVAGVSLADEREVTFGNEGTILFESAELPSMATIQQPSYGAANYYLTVPAATVTLGGVSGQPTLVYTVEIPALGYQRSSTYLLDTATGPRFEATMSAGTLTDQSFDRTEYNGTLSLGVRNASSQRTLTQQPITVRVVE